MLELKRPLVVLDVETTGTHPQCDKICQIGLVKVRPSGEKTEWQTLVYPKMPIPPEATAVHGITDEMVAEAPTFDLVAPRLAGGLKDCDLCGFNVRFDLLFLRKEFERVGGRGLLDGARIVDPFRIFLQRNPRSLSDAYERYVGKKLEGAHDALTDARATYEVLLGQLREYEDLPRSVEELHRIYFENPAEGHLDPDGKIAWRHGEATLNFGKHATTPLAKVGTSYLRWMAEQSDMSEATKRIVREALQGRFPRREDR